MRTVFSKLLSELKPCTYLAGVAGYAPLMRWQNRKDSLVRLANRADLASRIASEAICSTGIASGFGNHVGFDGIETCSSGLRPDSVHLVSLYRQEFEMIH